MHARRTWSSCLLWSDESRATTNRTHFREVCLNNEGVELDTLPLINTSLRFSKASAWGQHNIRTPMNTITQSLLAATTQNNLPPIPSFPNLPSYPHPCCLCSIRSCNLLSLISPTLLHITPPTFPPPNTCFSVSPHHVYHNTLHIQRTWAARKWNFLSSNLLARISSALFCTSSDPDTPSFSPSATPTSWTMTSKKDAGESSEVT